MSKRWLYLALVCIVLLMLMASAFFNSVLFRLNNFLLLIGLVFVLAALIYSRRKRH